MEKTSKTILPEEHRLEIDSIINHGGHGKVIQEYIRLYREALTSAEQENERKDQALITANETNLHWIQKAADLTQEMAVKDSIIADGKKHIEYFQDENAALKKENEELKEENKYKNEFVRMLKIDVLELSNKAQEYEECSDNPENGEFFKGKAEAYKYASKKIKDVIKYYGFDK